MKKEIVFKGISLISAYSEFFPGIMISYPFPNLYYFNLTLNQSHFGEGDSERGETPEVEAVLNYLVAVE